MTGSPSIFADSTATRPALAGASGSQIPRPTTMRRVWVPGIQYEGESLEQMEAREKRLREADALADAEEKRLYEWKCRPWWADSFPNNRDKPTTGS